MFQTIDQELGPLTGLVNNAGVNGNVCRVDEIDPVVSLELLRVNVLGYFIYAKHAISIHGGPGNYVDYASSKAAIDTFTIRLAKEQADQGIRVNTLRPGTTMTELSTAWANENPEWLDWVMAQAPMQRPAAVEEIASAAMFLLSGKSSYMTGATLDASGGWVSP